MSESLRILILEDDPNDAQLMELELRRGGLKVMSKCVVERDQFLQELEQAPPDVILSDHGLPSFDGFSALRLAKQKVPDIPFIFVTGSVGLEKAIEAFEHGASHYVLKSQLRSLATVVQRELEKSRRKKTLQEHEAQLRSIVESARHFAIFTTDLDGRVTTWNSGAEHLMGYTAEEITGQSTTIIFTPEDLASGQADKEMKSALTDGRAVNERWHVRKTGERFWGSGQLMPFVNSKGDTSGFLKIMQDHTERVHMEEALQKSEELYRSMVQAAKDYAIYLLDADGHITTWNPGAERTEGYRSEEIVGQHFSVLFTHDDVSKGVPNRELERARTTGKSTSDGYNVRKDGTMFWAEWTLTAIFDANHNLTGFCRIAHDITERKNLESEILALKEDLEQRVIRRTAELEATNKELDAFSYSISHDLRAPLRHVLAYVDFLKETINDPHDAPLYLDKISMSATKMEHLIEDLLTFSKIARTELRLSRVNLARLVHDVRMELQEDIQGRDVEWKIGELPTVQGDETALRQVFVNLMSNALKYSRSRSPAIVDIGTLRMNNELVCYVRDNGIGFDMHFSQKLFGLFQRLHADKNYPGTGVGLAIVRRVIRRHGGRVWAEGSVGKGATFYFSIPDKPETHGDVAARDMPAASVK